jgi:hypothetical protein
VGGNVWKAISRTSFKEATREKKNAEINAILKISIL